MTELEVCRCQKLDQIEGDAASPYARGHLLLKGVAPDARSAMWICPTTGWRWRETYFCAWRPDQPVARLDRLDRTSPRLVERRARIPWRPALAVLVAGLGLTTLLGLVVL